MKPEYEFTFKAYSTITMNGDIVDGIDVVVISDTLKYAIEKAIKISGLKCTDLISIKEIDTDE